MLPRRAVIFLALRLDPRDALSGSGHAAAQRAQHRCARRSSRRRSRPSRARLPDDPKAIEAYVLDKQVPYAYDWQSAGVPWYFPTTAEAVRAGARRLREPGGGAGEHPHRQGHPQRAAHELRPHLGGLPRQAVERAGERRGAVRRQRERPLLHPLAEGLPAWGRRSPTRWRSTGRRRRRGACCSSSAGSRSIVLWNALARLLGAGRLAADGLLPAGGRRAAAGSSGGAPHAGARRPSGALAGAQHA